MAVVAVANADEAGRRNAFHPGIVIVPLGTPRSCQPPPTVKLELVQDTYVLAVHICGDQGCPAFHRAIVLQSVIGGKIYPVKDDIVPANTLRKLLGELLALLVNVGVVIVVILTELGFLTI